MSTLTERYVWAVTRLLPEDQRPEIGDELRASIADMVEARGPDGAGPAASDEAERHVLAELGDPRILAAGYADRPRYLIGPEVFPDYLRVLRLVAAIAVPFVALGTALGQVLEEASAIEVVATSLGAAFQAAIHVGFWVTLGFALWSRPPDAGEWTLESLPEPPPPSHVGLGETVTGVALPLVAIAVLVWTGRRSPFTDAAGEPIPFFDPGLWHGWMQAAIALLLGGVVVALAVHRAGRWTTALAAVNAALDAALLGLVVWAATGDRLVNPAFLEAFARTAEMETVPTANGGIAVLAVGAVLGWDAVDGFLQARRARAAA
jgi:hypothetical protein